jgi:hypothetical protein
VLIIKFIHSSVALQSFVGPWSLLQFRNIFYTDSRTPWTSDQAFARSLPTHKTTQTQKKHTHTDIHALSGIRNPRSQISSERRQFIPYCAATAQRASSIRGGHGLIPITRKARRQAVHCIGLALCGRVRCLFREGLATHSVPNELDCDSRLT